MIGLEGRLQWRQHKLFKLRARRVQRKNSINYKELLRRLFTRATGEPHRKFAIRSILVRRTRIEQSFHPVIARSSCDEAVQPRAWLWIASLRSQ
jgi:hypothetical protein